MSRLWTSTDPEEWRAALATYPKAIAARDPDGLPPLDIWYREELPRLLAERQPPYITLADLTRIAAWKMAKGVFRHRNLMLLRANRTAVVQEASRTAFAQAPDLRWPIETLAKLAGVGAATASAVMSAYAPDRYPFLDEKVAKQIPGLGKKVDFSVPYYLAFAEALRRRATELGPEWTPTSVERALWAS